MPIPRHRHPDAKITFHLGSTEVGDLLDGQYYLARYAATNSQRARATRMWSVLQYRHTMAWGAYTGGTADDTPELDHQAASDPAGWTDLTDAAEPAGLPDSP